MSKEKEKTRTHGGKFKASKVDKPGIGRRKRRAVGLFWAYAKFNPAYWLIRAIDGKDPRRPDAWRPFTGREPLAAFFGHFMRWIRG